MFFRCLVQSIILSLTTPGYPNKGKLDLMKYYDASKRQPEKRQRINDSMAMEIDIKRLIWSSEILWKD